MEEEGERAGEGVKVKESKCEREGVRQQESDTGKDSEGERKMKSKTSGYTSD